MVRMVLVVMVVLAAVLNHSKSTHLLPHMSNTLLCFCLLPLLYLQTTPVVQTNNPCCTNKRPLLYLQTTTKQTRLHELSQDLLGPPTWEPSWLPWPWDPRVVGGALVKRELLGGIVVPGMAKERLPLAAQVGGSV